MTTEKFQKLEKLVEGVRKGKHYLKHNVYLNDSGRMSLYASENQTLTPLGEARVAQALRTGRLYCRSSDWLVYYSEDLK